MRNVLILTFMFISVCCLGQVPTDWQVDGLKGKVKKSTTSWLLSDTAIVIEETSYNKQGFKTEIRHYDDYSFSEQQKGIKPKCTALDKFSVLDTTSKREVITYDCFSKKVLNKEVKRVEYWESDKIYVVSEEYLDSKEIRFTKQYFEGYRLMKSTSYVSSSQDDNSDNRPTPTAYFYNEVGDLVKTHTYFDMVDSTGDRITTIAVVNKDEKGNVVEYKERVEGTELGSNVSCRYEYYE